MKTFPLIYLITDGQMTAQNFSTRKTQVLDLVRLAAQNNISLIQIREKQISARLVYELTCAVIKITQNSETKILVNDRADIAQAANADGVQLTSGSVSCQTIRQNFPKDFIVGVSTHSLKEAAEAKKQAANFAVFSPIFTSPDKGQPLGIKKLRRICERLKPFPIVALGGIDETNYRTVLENGAHGFAAIRFLNNGENIKNLSAQNFDEYQ